MLPIHTSFCNCYTTPPRSVFRYHDEPTVSRPCWVSPEVAGRQLDVFTSIENVIRDTPAGITKENPAQTVILFDRALCIMGQSTLVLHVDDEQSFAELTATVLERQDERFTVETAHSADEALERIRDRPPDCIVSDYNMPGMDGLAFLQTVRETWPDLPFILFTGKGGEEVASDAIAAGVTDYIQKRSGSEQYELLANRIQNAVTARRGAKEATRQQDLMERVEVLGSTGGWELEAESERLRLTNGLKQLYGMEPGRNPSMEEVMELYEPDSQQRIRSVIDSARASGFATADELHLRAANGETRIVEGNAELIDSDGDRTVLRGVVQDITERTERERELRAERRFIETALADGEVTVETNLRTAGGQHIPYEFTGARLTDEDGNVTGLVGVGRDLSDRDERGYRELAEEYEALLETSGDAIFLLDVDTTGERPTFEFARLSPGYEEQTGLSTEAVRGKSPRAVFGEEEGAELEANYTRCVEQRAPVSYREEPDIADDARFWETSLAPVVVDDEVIRVVGIARNVTEQVERERELRRQNER
jgi:PAS domain S-box-containing protein